jgi:hypothetical protein
MQGNGFAITNTQPYLFDPIIKCIDPNLTMGQSLKLPSPIKAHEVAHRAPYKGGCASPVIARDRTKSVGGDGPAPYKDAIYGEEEFETLSRNHTQGVGNGFRPARNEKYGSWKMTSTITGLVPAI